MAADVHQHRWLPAKQASFATPRANVRDYWCAWIPVHRDASPSLILWFPQPTAFSLQ